MTVLRLATRRSPLALAQSRWVGEQLSRRTGAQVRLVEVTTEGDRAAGPLELMGGTGVFAAAVRRAVIDGEADLAVHSLKDLPTAPEEGLRLAAVPPREDPRDVLVGRSLPDLPREALVGTGSPRRRAQLVAARPDLRIVGVRGNVQTRIGRVRALAEPTTHGRGGSERESERAGGTGADLDAVVLAAAGLVRLGKRDTICQYLDPDVMLPAAGQGALAVEVRADHTEFDEVLGDLDDGATRAAVVAERAFLAQLEGGCSAPAGALAQVDGAGPDAALRLRVVLAREDGVLARRFIAGAAGRADQLGRQLAVELLEAGFIGGVATDEE